MMHKNILILAGGMSSRMKKSSVVSFLSDQEKLEADTGSKSLIRFGKDKRPFLDYLLLNAKEAGFRYIYIVTGENNLNFKQYYDKENKHNDFACMDINIAIQYIHKGRNKPFGTADAITQTLDQFPELKESSFTVCNSDNLYSVEVMKALRENNSKNALIAYDRNALRFPEDKIAKFALIDYDKNNNLINIIEKPNNRELEFYKGKRKTIRVSMNIFNFNGRITYPYFKSCPISSRDEKEIPSVLKNILQDGTDSITCIPYSEHVPDLTSKEDIIVMKKYLAKHFPDFQE